MEDFFKDLLWDNLIKFALGELFKKFPLLGWGPVGYLVSFFVSKFANELYEVIRLAINVQVMTFRNKELEKEFEAASVRLKIVAKSYGVESDEFKQVRKVNREKLSNFVRFNVAR